MRAKRLRIAAALLVGITLIAIVDHTRGILPIGDDWHRYHGKTFEVMRVIDGDTLDLRTPDGDRATTRVRLWGVDTPEISRDPDEPDEDYARDALKHTRQHAEDASVTLYLQKHRTRGRYGRLLAYVELPEGQDLGGELLAEGLAERDGRWGHDRMRAYRELEDAARDQAVGIWSE